MKKGKIAITITIGIMFLILTAVIFLQVKTIKQTDVTSIENMREDEIRTEITSYKQKNEELKNKIEELNLKISEYEEISSSDKEASELLEQELTQLNNILGKNDVTGPGVIVTLTDTRYQKIDSEDLRDLLNALKAAGAEAISINDQRIVYDTYIVDINNTFISVGGANMVSPYVVKAIGDSKYLESGLNQKQYGYIDTVLAEGKDVTLESSDDIFIGKYTGNLSMEYAKEEQ